MSTARSGRRSGATVLVARRIIVPLAAIAGAAALAVLIAALRADAHLIDRRPEAARVALEWIGAAALIGVAAPAALLAVVVAQTTLVVRTLRSERAVTDPDLAPRSLRRLGAIGDAIEAHTGFMHQRNRRYAPKTRNQSRLIGMLTAVAAAPTAVCDGIGRVLYASPGFPIAVDSTVEPTSGFRRAIATLLDIGHAPSVTIAGERYFVQAVFDTTGDQSAAPRTTAIVYIVVSQVELHARAAASPSGRRKPRRRFLPFGHKREW